MTPTASCRHLAPNVPGANDPNAIGRVRGRDESDPIAVGRVRVRFETHPNATGRARGNRIDAVAIASGNGRGDVLRGVLGVRVRGRRAEYIIRKLE